MISQKKHFDDKSKNLNKKVSSNKTKHIEAEKILSDLKNRVVQISEKGYDFLLSVMYFTGDDGYQNLLIFVPTLSLLILDSNKIVTIQISTETSSEKIKPVILILNQPCLVWPMIE